MLDYTSKSKYGTIDVKTTRDFAKRVAKDFNFTIELGVIGDQVTRERKAYTNQITNLKGGLVYKTNNFYNYDITNSQVIQYVKQRNIDILQTPMRKLKPQDYYSIAKALGNILYTSKSKNSVNKFGKTFLNIIKNFAFQGKFGYQSNPAGFRKGVRSGQLVNSLSFKEGKEYK